MQDAVQAPPGGGRAADPQRWARGWRRAALSAGMLVYPSVTAIGVAQYSSGAAAAAGFAIAGAFVVTYVLAGVCVVRRDQNRLWICYAVMIVLFVAELPFARNFAFFLWAVITALTALMLRRRILLIVLAGALPTLLVPWAVRPWHTGPDALLALMVVFTTVTVYAYAEMAGANEALVEARAEVARLASEAERARIARDLHDLLGHSLTVITVKSGLARRLAESGSPRSAVEISEVEELSRQALTDVRAAVSGYREVSLASELARGREVLRAAGVVADLPTATEMVDPAHQELFGWVVREGLTNVVRHAHATRCTVSLTPTGVEIVDDGVGAPAPGGNGLTGLRERVAAAGGGVEAGPVRPRGWRLKVTVGTAEDERP
ncbi:sensor histidine kinase [Actinomadura violacea]|uniref:Sensor histidine kinase n=1 Tax=Actinomadura violacea TaxID=2819934 RepID=A0ABS3S716_9ACTN|nr:sensor histidine kinase [Actinomadura violacea]MBO2464803.1 sensor histidine kinase [Actinomadura violacea]